MIAGLALSTPTMAIMLSTRRQVSPQVFSRLGAGGRWPLTHRSTLYSFWTIYVWQENSNFTVELLDMTHHTPVNTDSPSTTSAPAQDILVQLNRFIRWGTNGLAVNDMQGNLYLISGSFVSAASHKSRSQTPVKRVRTREAVP